LVLKEWRNFLYKSTALIQPRPSPSQPKFKNQQQYRCYRQFCEQNAYKLSGYYDSDLWSRLVLQACETDSFIRHIVTAIGALTFNSWNNTASHREEPLSRQFAYTEYSIAIAELKTAFEQRKVDTRTKLLVCILFACFECYHLNNDAAIRQILTAVNLVQENAELRGKLQRKADSTPLLPPPIDDEIEDCIVRLEVQVIAYGIGYTVPRSAYQYSQKMRRGQAIVDKLPTPFTSLKEARTALNVVMLRAMHWHLSGGDYVQNLKVSWAEALQHPHAVDPTYPQFCNTTDEYQWWSLAFTPLLKTARTQRDPALFKGATLLRIHYLASDLCVATYSPLVQYYYTQRTPQLTELVGLIQDMIDTPDMPLVEDTDFQLDIKLIIPLNVVGLKYRHRALRRRAIDILLSLPRREGVWDGMTVGKLTKWIADIEDEGLEGEEEYVPLERMVNITDLKFDSVGRKAYASCVQPVDGNPHETVYREITISW
jgi:hypothetical protein